MKLKIFNFTKSDIILIAIISIFALLFHVLFVWFFSIGSANAVKITVNGEVYGTYNLMQITEEKTVDVKTEFGHNTVVITKDGAYVSYADCPDKIDVQSGKITKPGQIIICIPNRLSVQVLGENSLVDVVAY